MPTTYRQPGFLARHPGSVLAVVLATGAVLGLKHQAANLRANDAAQRAQPSSFHVSVDRSGGGV